MLSKTQQRRARLQSKKSQKRQQDLEDDKFLEQFRAEVSDAPTLKMNPDVNESIFTSTQELPSTTESTSTDTSESTPISISTDTQALPSTTESTSTSESKTMSDTPSTQSHQSQPKVNPKAPSSEFGVPKDKILEKASELWKTLKEHIKKDNDFKEMENQDKLELFRTKYGYAMFMDEFPIVSRYMICYGQYSEKAFSRMLRKIETTVHPPPEKRDKGYMEDQWVRRQADYVQYLWESYQKRHQNTAERQWIWQSTYERLRKEFDDFRDMHKDIEERVKKEKKTLAGQNARELLERLAAGKQQLSKEEEEFLLTQLSEVFDKKLNGTLDAEAEEEEPKKDNNKIVMIETVDVERMKEIDDIYKPPELRQMEPVLDDVYTPPALHKMDPVLEEVDMATSSESSS
jgi:hypothetical protein